MERPRILLVPTLTEIEWRIRPQLEEWAEVASYDVPGVGVEPPAEQPGMKALHARAVEELDRRGWDRCVIACDEWGGYTAVRVAAAERDRVAGLAFGHPCLSYLSDGERAPVNGEVMNAFFGLADVDYRTYVRHLTQLTQVAYDDETADEYLRRVPQEVTVAYLPVLAGAVAADSAEPLLRELDRPLLLAKHEGCLAWTDEGFEDVVAAFPDATRMATAEKPSVSSEFAEALREFCGSLDWA